MKPLTGATAALLSLLLATIPAFADDTSTGVAPPRVGFAPDGLVLRTQPQVRLDGRRVLLHMTLTVTSAARHPKGWVTMAPFKWRGEGDPYPDRQYPELAVRVDGRTTRVRDGFKAETAKGDITGLLRAARIDPFVIADSPPIVDVDKLGRREAQALRDAGALKQDPDAGDLAMWYAQRKVGFDLPANRPAVLEVRYIARPAFSLRPATDSELDPRLRQACASMAGLREQAAQVLVGESVLVEEYAFDVAANAQANEAVVALDLRAATDAPATVYVVCGAEGAGLVGVGHLSGLGARGSDGLVHVVALSVPTLPSKR